jgi:membrane protein YqaA with SNARE-associated domain
MLEQNIALLKECRVAFDWWERFASTRRASVLLFAWALAEATFWPIIPDFLLVPLAVGMSVAGGRRFYLPLACAISGAALGGTIMFLLAYLAPNEALAKLRYLPFVRDAQIHTVSAQLATDGPLAFFVQPWSGIQFKVWGIVAGAQGIAPWQAIPAFIVARGLRMALFATLARLLAARFTGFVRDNSIFLAGIYVVLFFFSWWQVIG